MNGMSILKFFLRVLRIFAISETQPDNKNKYKQYIKARKEAGIK